MSQEKCKAIEIIETMPRKEFHQKFVKGIGQTQSFGALVF